MTQTYKEYLGEIEFTVIESVEELTEEMLYDLETKTGYVIEGEYDIYLCKKFEPMEFLNQLVVMEKVNEFYVVDMLGIIMFDGSAEEVIQYVEGFFNEEEIF